MGILHTGQHYPDDLTDDGVIYHYPETARPPSRDRGEIEATKTAARLGLPVFVILPGLGRANRRTVKLGWVEDWDDASKQFLIFFGEEPPPNDPAPELEAPFDLIEDGSLKVVQAKARKRQQRFRFQVLYKYGYKCAVCEINHLRLLQAAHLRGIADKGSDDWRNGLPLCANHHEAFDANLFAIVPEVLEIQVAPNVTRESIGIHTERIEPLQNRPHPTALEWRYKQTLAAWH